MSTVSIESGLGKLVVKVNGKPVPAHSVQMRGSADPREVPECIVTLAGDAEVDLEGVIYVQSEPKLEDLIEHIRGWFAEIDVDQIRGEVAALPRKTMKDDDVSLTLQVLADRLGAS